MTRNIRMRLRSDMATTILDDDFQNGVRLKKRHKKRVINLLVDVFLFAYRKALKSIPEGRQVGHFVRQDVAEVSRLDCERIQAIARNQQASKARSKGRAVFRRRQACCQSGQVRSLKPTGREYAGRYQDQSGCKCVSWLYAVTNAFRILPTIFGSSTPARLDFRMLGQV